MLLLLFVCLFVWGGGHNALNCHIQSNRGQKSFNVNVCLSGYCLTAEMDFTHNRNSPANFLRVCNFALRVFLITSHLEDALCALGASIMNSSNNLKFRKPVYFLQSYSIHTRVSSNFRNSVSFSSRSGLSCHQHHRQYHVCRCPSSCHFSSVFH